MMQKLTYEVRFVTPAFLGNAEQKGQWRTPPFKALIREWWRVVKAKDIGYDHEKLREEEGHLFGAAHDEGGGSQKSRMLVRISEWNDGVLKQWPNDPRVKHSEVDKGGGNIGAHLYLAYGPLTYTKGVGTALKDAHPAIESNKTTKLSLVYPDFFTDDIDNAIKLINWFGTVGGRSRNGWGSLMLSGDGIAHDIDLKIVAQFSRPLADCLRLDWPHAFGKDEKGLLIWKTKNNFHTWEDIMKALAAIKIEFRTALPFKQVTPGAFEKRHVLAYPVTNHPVHKWGNQSRLANQLRFKVALVNGKFRGIAYHLPCSAPRELMLKIDQSDANDQAAIWKIVHDNLNAHMDRIG